MSSLYEINEVMDEFLNQIDEVKQDVLVKSGVVVVSISSLVLVAGQ